MLHQHGIALALRDRHRDDLVAEAAAVDRLHRPPLALVGEGVLLLAGDLRLELLVDVLGGLAHDLQGEHRLHLRIGEAPAEGGIPRRDVADRPALAALGDGVGATAHALHAASDEHLPLPGQDGPRRHVDRAQAAGAQPVKRDRRHRHREAGQQRRHAGHVAVILPGLVGAAQVHLLDCGGVQPRPCHQGLEHVGGQVIGAHLAERAAHTPDRRAQRVDDHDFGHGLNLYSVERMGI